MDLEKVKQQALSALSRHLLATQISGPHSENRAIFSKEKTVVLELRPNYKYGDKQKKCDYDFYYHAREDVPTLARAVLTLLEQLKQKEAPNDTGQAP